MTVDRHQDATVHDVPVRQGLARRRQRRRRAALQADIPQRPAALRADEAISAARPRPLEPSGVDLPETVTTPAPDHPTLRIHLEVHAAHAALLLVRVVVLTVRILVRAFVFVVIVARPHAPSLLFGRTRVSPGRPSFVLCVFTRMTGTQLASLAARARSRGLRLQGPGRNNARNTSPRAEPRVFWHENEGTLARALAR